MKANRHLPLGLLCSAAMAALTLVSGLNSAGATSTDEPQLAAPATPEDLQSAREDFVMLCSGCHGDNAKGGGPVAIELKTRPADLTRIAARHDGNFDREAVYKKIEGLDMPLAHGTSEMPIWGAWFVHQAVGEGVLLEDARTAAKVARKRINDLVKYLETLQEE